ncbi:hypothetical protein GA0070612_3353 [Micromonospora chokoriensis]|uniref:Uncharacterized protein n=1 Tax=Micromonospora chokoriensis TaxID=356851 RepID=A0A1C4XA68_9ACTN|nr:hypothetical protein GA0070612_3353 [Micromonospora chokoriensis]
MREDAVAEFVDLRREVERLRAENARLARLVITSDALS